MTRRRTTPRLLTLACMAAALAAAGCGRSDPPAPTMGEQERQEMIRRDAEQVMKERRQSRPQSPMR